MRAVNQIVLASTNHDKYVEFKGLLKAYPEIEILPADQFIRNADKIGLVEKYDNYRDNAVAKARLANHACHYPCLADDSGLEVEALDGKPGIHSRRFSTPKVGQTQDMSNVEKLLESLKGKPMAARKARFVATLALVMEGILVHAEGVLEGTIAEAPQGKGGFGYDPVFIPNGQSRTLAEMSFDEKNALSHRAVAIHKLVSEMRSRGILLVKP